MAKVLFMIHSLFPGGTETHVLTLAQALKSTGHQVGVVTSGGPWVRRFRREGVQVHVVPGFARGSHQSLLSLRRVVVRGGYRVVHAHDHASFVMAAKLGMRIRTVFTVHGTYDASARVLRSTRAAHAVIAVSPSVYSHLTRNCHVPAHRVRIIPNGVPTDRFRPLALRGAFRKRYNIPDSAFLLGYAGRFTHLKRDVGLRVVRLLQVYARQHPGVRIVVAGRGSEAIFRAVGGAVTACGTLSNMASFYNACDVVLGTARVALESAACGVPTIAVGEQSYLGILHKRILNAAHRTNFGDHGSYRTWTSRQLFRDLSYIRSHPAIVRTGALRLRQSVIDRFSLRTVLRSMRSVYKI